MNEKTPAAAGDEHAHDDDDKHAGGAGDGGEFKSAATPEQQERARNMGWRPKDEYTGPRPWVDADAYIANVEANFPVVIERNRFLGDQLTKTSKDLESAHKKLDEMSGAMRDLNEYHQRNNKAAYERARKDIIEEQRRAAENADVAGVTSAQQRLDQLDNEHREVTAPKQAAPEKKPETPPASATAPIISDVAKAYIDKNKRIMDDPVLYPASVAQHALNLEEGMSEAESFAVLNGQLAQQFPKRFDNPARHAAPAVRPPAPPAPPKKKNERSFENLPAEAQAEADKLVRQIPGFTREQYVNEYQW